MVIERLQGRGEETKTGEGGLFTLILNGRPFFPVPLGAVRNLNP